MTKSSEKQLIMEGNRWLALFKPIPECPACNKPMKNAYDSKLKKISRYLWQTDCKHHRNLRLSIG